jgi:hypothetical protein
MNGVADSAIGTPAGIAGFDRLEIGSVRQISHSE